MMRIAFDGGCFQQTILGGIYHVACGFLKAARRLDPDFEVLLVCDARMGPVHPEAIAGLGWQPEVIYAPIALSYDPPGGDSMTPDPAIRFLVDGQVVAVEYRDGAAVYEGPKPKQSFVILSRSSSPANAAVHLALGIEVRTIEVSSAARDGTVSRYRGGDRRLNAGFVHHDGGNWTDGAGVVPLGWFDEHADDVTVTISFRAQDRYSLGDGAAADLVIAARRDVRDAERRELIAATAADLRERGYNIYFANHFTPVHFPGLINVAWSYDLIPVLFPQFFHPDAQLNFDENIRIFRAADRLYAISECTRQDLIENLSLPEDQVIAAGISVPDDFADIRAKSTEAILARAAVAPKKYILVVGTIEPRKNHLRIMLAYLSLRDRIDDCPDLVFIGKLGWDFEDVLELRAAGHYDSMIKILTDVSDEDLAILYRNALFGAYLSVYEGFGLPVLEAMLCECPVVTSDRSSLPEVAGDAALLVDPYDVDAMATAFERLASDEALRTELVSRGRQRAKLFSWERSANTILSDLTRIQQGR